LPPVTGLAPVGLKTTQALKRQMNFSFQLALQQLIRTKAGWPPVVPLVAFKYKTLACLIPFAIIIIKFFFGLFNSTQKAPIFSLFEKKSSFKTPLNLLSSAWPIL
jgi:hypothetical protein